MTIAPNIKINLRTITGTIMCLAGTMQLTFFPQITGEGAKLSVWGYSVATIFVGATLLLIGEWFNEDHKDRKNGGGYR